MRLSTAIHRYVEWKRFCGRTFGSGEQILLHYLKAVGDLSLSDLTRGHISSYLRGQRIRVETWRGKYGTLERFLRHWAARGEMRRIPLARPRFAPRNVLIPHVYSREQIRKLLKTVESNQRSLNCVIDARTIRVFLLFLYGTGAYLGEALRLKRSDVDFERGTIRVRRVADVRERTLPISGHLRHVLQSYQDALPESYRTSEAFFIDKLGRPLNPTTVSKAYQKLRRRAHVFRTDGLKNRPRLHDFRHTFAVHTLTAWLNQGKDLRRMLPALSAYLGLTKFASADRYLRMVPDRFRAQVAVLVGTQARVAPMHCR